jgi:hypothetical protein
MTVPHLADAENGYVVINITPDFCKVGKKVVPFDIFQRLSPEKTGYAQTVFARDEKVILIDSVIKGVIGNAGKGVKSGVSAGKGDNVVIQGSPTVIIEDKLAARHDDLVQMNVEIS